MLVEVEPLSWGYGGADDEPESIEGAGVLGRGGEACRFASGP